MEISQLRKGDIGELKANPNPNPNPNPNWKGDIGELKALKHPTSGVVKTLICVLMLFKVPKKKHTLGEARAFISQSDFLTKFEAFDLTRDTPEQIQMHKDLSSKCKDIEFEPEELRHTSMAAAVLCQWCIAVNAHWNTAEEVNNHSLLRTHCVYLGCLLPCFSGIQDVR